MNPDTKTPPVPAPLPYGSQAGRGQIPALPRPELVDPDAPRMREDELVLWVSTSIVAALVLLMAVVAALGGI